MIIEFTKMQGLGNDYIYINCINYEYKEIYENISKLCNRNFGIGADGVILIMKSKVADFKMRIFNADGTEAQMCGNGIRCVGKFLYDKKITSKTELSIETLCGIKKLKLYINDNKVTEVQVDMGEPSIEPKKIPIVGDSNKKVININKEKIELKCISMGNPHAITIVNNIRDINISKYGPIIENDIAFPERTNVEFVEILDKKNIKMRVWERGAKETLACGTGACASTVICNLEGYTENEVNVHLLGGILNIRWDQNNNHVYMKGPAKIVFEGKIEI